ncbi:alpha/beta fold hydrolase [Nocardia bovistercoris]|uniref:Alpha/beta hydrolase n=1 Tax=Nocardia bovistercoris TaxID=2785916 RepID=A0A931N2U8_9NOCA|nr:alpha/beta hydrolase [Nocardia bovistercoris]MBH0779900.1 alpha/beta hydrolase [Nocardia bovistercoris]
MTVGTPESTVPIGDLTFEVRTEGSGDGPIAVLLHGFPQSSASWIPLSALLAAEGVRTYAPDQRGYSPGACPADPAAYSLSALTDDVSRLCDAIGADSVHLVGHDWGAIVAWSLAAREPDRVRSLTAVSVPHPAGFAHAIESDPTQRETSQYMSTLEAAGTEDLLLADDAAALRIGFGADVAPELADHHVRVLSRPGAMTAALNWYRTARPDWATVPPVRVPTTYLWGSADMAIAHSAALTCEPYVEADFTFVALDGIGHWVPEQAPEALAAHVLARIEGGARIAD